jgi:flagellar hook-associated protein 2
LRLAAALFLGIFMAGTITFSGLGSGIDIDSLVTGLVKAESAGLNQTNTRISATRAAVSDMSSVGSLLSDLKTVVDSLDTASELASYSATSSKPDVLTAVTSGTARPASYDVKVISLVKEQRNYSTTFASRTDDLNQAGTLRFGQNGNTYDVAVEASDSLDEIAAKINGSGAKIKANVFYDGSQYRLQLSGSEGGADGAFTISDVSSSMSLGFDAPDSKKQSAADAEVLIDGLSVKRKTNTIDGAIDGVTLKLTAETSDTIKLQVASDPTKLTASLKDFVAKYNAVVTKVHKVAGFGSTAASNPELAGDQTLRTITAGLGNRVLSRAGTGGTLDSLADLGIRLNNDGTLRLDETKMAKALADHPDDFSKALAGTDTSDGLMDLMSDMLKGFTDATDGLMTSRKTSYDARIKSLQTAADREQARLDRMADRLRTTFTKMDTAVAAANQSMSYLYNMG